jgi:hypothetical protein
MMHSHTQNKREVAVALFCPAQQRHHNITAFVDTAVATTHPPSTQTPKRSTSGPRFKYLRRSAERALGSLWDIIKTRPGRVARDRFTSLVLFGHARVLFPAPHLKGDSSAAGRVGKRNKQYCAGALVAFVITSVIP